MTIECGSFCKIIIEHKVNYPELAKVEGVFQVLEVNDKNVQVESVEKPEINDWVNIRRKESNGTQS